MARTRRRTARKVSVACDRPRSARPLPTQFAVSAGHAHLKKLVEIRTGDAEEFDPLQQRVARIQGLIEDPLVEFEPRQLAADKVDAEKDFTDTASYRRVRPKVSRPAM
jgi:hypothetical protein